MKEYPYANGFKPFDEMRQADGRWFLPEGEPNLPLMYAIMVGKAG